MVTQLDRLMKALLQICYNPTLLSWSFPNTYGTYAATRLAFAGPESTGMFAFAELSRLEVRIFV